MAFRVVNRLRNFLQAHQALKSAKKAFAAGERDAAVLKSNMTLILQAADVDRVDYVSVADLVSLDELKYITNGALISLAVFIGGVRLIDNFVVGN